MARKTFVLLLHAAVVGSLLAYSASVAQAWTFKTLYSFCAYKNCIDGEAPHSTVILDASGNLYGATKEGGDKGRGVLFKLTRNSDTGDYTYSRLYSFCKDRLCSDGEYPNGDLISDVSGNLYGTAQGGDTDGNCGKVFKFTLRGSTYKVLHAFACSEGNAPTGLSYVGAAARYNGTSSLYGVTAAGGAHNEGILYQLTPGNPVWTIKVLHTFCSEADCADGENPAAKLLPVQSDLLYGTTVNGGAKNGGTTFKLSRTGSTWSESVLHDFCSDLDCTDGRYVVGGVLQDRSTGTLFGMTTLGGTGDQGVAYTLADDGSSFQVIHNFCSDESCAEGGFPAGELRRLGKTSFFGVTEFGGDSSGTVFQLKSVHGHWVATSLHTFQADCSDGCTPLRQQLAMDANGNLFGSTSEGGQFGLKAGTVFELSP